ncbi:MAG: hypothetical protein V4772_18935 [Pseudomonadota bacterium]
MLRKPQATLALLAISLFCCSPAWAHDAFGNGKSVLTGALHLLTSPLSIAALLGLILALVGIPERLSFIAGGLAAAASAAAAAAPAFSANLAASTAPAAVVVIGLTSVFAIKPSATGVIVLSLLAGTAAGQAADLDTPSWQGVIGVAGVMLFITISALAASEDLSRLVQSKPPWLKAALPIARRVVGSWLAAIGLLLAALALHAKPV